MATAVHQPPPDPPELPEGVDPAPRWPAWYAPAGFGVFLILTLMSQGLLLAVSGADPSDPGAAFNVIGTVLMGVTAIGTAALFASFAGRPRPSHFGLRSAPFWPTVGWAALGLFSFYVFAAVYASAVQPDVEQSVTESLGADEGSLGLAAAGFVVVCIAPVAEEVFFRGFFYRALRSRFSVLVAAAIDGLVFGLIHYEGCEEGDRSCSGADGLLLVPPLGVLGVIFCLVYERTGSLFPVIALHALNNALAFGVQADGWGVSLVLAPLMIVACALVPRIIGSGPQPAAAR
jgi:membrane protease YdiL (CAAX protease family)